MQRNTKLVHPYCGGEIVESVAQGIQPYRDFDPQIFRCEKCGKEFASEDMQVLAKNPSGS